MVAAVSAQLWGEGGKRTVTNALLQPIHPLQSSAHSVENGQDSKSGLHLPFPVRTWVQAFCARAASLEEHNGVSSSTFSTYRTIYPVRGEAPTSLQ